MSSLTRALRDWDREKPQGGAPNAYVSLTFRMHVLSLTRMRCQYFCAHFIFRVLTLIEKFSVHEVHQLESSDMYEAVVRLSKSAKFVAI